MRYLSSSAPAAERRPGVVLLVVMAMLALFASLALSFVFYADAEATSTQLAMQSQVKPVADVDPETLAAYFLGQLLYDSNNTESQLRGWSLARSIYGYNPAVLNCIPYNGVGRTALAQAMAFPNGVNVNNVDLVNYQQYAPPLGVPPAWNAGTGYVFGNRVRHLGSVYFCAQANTAKNPATPGNFGIGSYWMLQPADPAWVNAARTPEWYGTSAAAGTYRYVGGANPPWTSFDTNSLFLAQMNADGTLLTPSFYRPWWNTGVAGNSSAQRYASLSPDQHWNPTFYPLPDADDGIGATTNHVRNRDSGPPGNDSKWMDVGFPIFTAPNGKRYKPLVASLILDLNSRINMWAHGNRRGNNTLTNVYPIHVSNQGWGPSEVNLSRLTGMNFAELQAFFNWKYGNTVNNTTAAAPLGSPLNFPNASVTPSSAPPWYATGDYDAGGANPANTMTVGTYPFLEGGATTTTTNLIPGAGSHPVVTALASNLSATGFPLVTIGTQVTVGAGATSETVAVTNVTAAPFSFTAVFARRHAIGSAVAIGSPHFAFPYYYPVGWNNSVNEITANPGLGIPNAPLGFSVFNPIFPNTRPNTGSLEALSRYYGTNGPSLPSDIFQRMPNTFADPQPPVGTTLRGPVTLPAAGVPALLTVPVASVANIVVGMPLTVGNENVIVTAVNAAAAPPTITAIFTQNHAIRPPTTVTYTFTRGLSNKVTMSSAWLDRITAAPYINFNPTPANWNAATAYPAGTQVSSAGIVYTATAGNTNRNPATSPGIWTALGYQLSTLPYPQAVAPSNTTWPAQTWSAPTAPLNSDFIANDFRSNLGQLLRVNLNRTLRDFPLAGANGMIALNGAGNAANLLQFENALNDRTQFARDLYNALVRVTGAQDPNKTAAAVPTSADYLAARWLAQLAVNIVDFIDNDDYSTPFIWNANNTSDIVFGTELPRLVLNEVYAAHQTAPANQIGVWAELHNTFKPTLAGSIYPLDNGAALLQTANGQAAYKIETYKSTPALTSALRDPSNATGVAGAMIRPVAPPGLAPTGASAVNAAGRTTVTIDTLAPHGLAAGDQVVVAGVENAAGALIPQYNGTFTVLTVTATSFTFQIPFHPAPLAHGGGGYATPVPLVAQTTWGNLPLTQMVLANTGGTVAPVAAVSPNHTIATATVGAGVVTIKTVAAHGFQNGQAVTITGVIPSVPTPGYLEGSYNITLVNPTTFTFPTPPGVAANGSGGTALGATNPNAGFYVIGPGGMSYSSAATNPNLPATYVSPAMAITLPPPPPPPTPKNIAPFAAVGATGASVSPISPTTATITTVAPHGFISSTPTTNLVTITGVVNPAYNVPAPGTPITVTGPRTFTYTLAAPLPAPSRSGSPPLPAPSATATQILSAGATSIPNITVLLRRLANPHLPYNNNAPGTAANPYNPYITVDYLDGIGVIQPPGAGGGGGGGGGGGPIFTIRPAVPPGIGASARAFLGAVTVTINTVPVAGGTGLVVGNTVTIAGVATLAGVPVPAYNSTFTITAIGGPNQFSFTLPAGSPVPPNAGGGTVTLVAAGGAGGGNPALGTSFGRKQPYAAHSSQILAQVGTSAAGQPANTFFIHNSNAPGPFDWLVHLDRAPVNALELLNVSGFKPHELTQQFVYPSTSVAPTAYNVATPYVAGNCVTQNGVIYDCILANTGKTPPNAAFWTPVPAVKFQHYAPWNPFAPGPNPTNANPAPSQSSATIQSALIYRVLDLLSTANHMPGTSIGSRQPGGINPNTVTEADIWQALCDSQDFAPISTQTQPRFTANDVRTIFNNISGPNVGRNAPAAAPLNALEGTPFKSFAAGNVTDTMFRLQTGATTPIFQPSSTTAAYHPTLRSGLLQKIFNNMTTTSNVFAVYWTVGFFEVTDETVQPPRLGQEIGRSENRNIRHRFFAIVDRSGMQLINTNSTNAVLGTTNVWTNTQAYRRNDLVLYQGASYKCLAPNTNFPPTVNASNAKWTLESMNINAITGTPLGGPPPVWSATQSYATSNAVTYTNPATVPPTTNVYLCTQANTGAPPAASPGSWIMLMIQPGMLLEITDNSVSPPVSEVVPVTWVNPNMTSFTAPFTQSYNAGSTVVCRGNPGPQTSYPNAYNPHKDNSVVLHLSIIK